MTTFDVVIVGGGPAGSNCARFLTRGGLRVAIVDRAEFPRVKLCAGWLSAPIWDALAIAPAEYPGGLWEWNTCHVHYRGADHAIDVRGWFIRRFELDEFLLRTSGAELFLGRQVKAIERGDDGLWTIGDLRARHLVGAGGTHCPVARLVGPERARGPVGVQEHEFRIDLEAVARTRIGGDGEPELLLHDDLRGYSWNVPKSDWLNVGCGTLDAGHVRGAWQRARDHFQSAGHVPDEATEPLEHMKGHSYHLYDPLHLERAVQIDERGGAYLIGDSLGLAQPMTAEGILPAALSGRLLAEAILAGDAARYPSTLRAHPIIADYERVFRLREAGATLRQRANRNGHGDGAPRPLAALGRAGAKVAARTGAKVAARLGTGIGGRALATGFAWMFSGARLPAPQLVDLVLAGADRWLARPSSSSGSH